jgi:hypothetical protein
MGREQFEMEKLETIRKFKCDICNGNLGVYHEMNNKMMWGSLAVRNRKEI